MVIYSDSVHAFTKPAAGSDKSKGAAYNEPADKRSWKAMKVFLKELKEMGFDGVQNFPTVGVMDGNYRQNLEETGFGYDLEVEKDRLKDRLEKEVRVYAAAQYRRGEISDAIVAHMVTNALLAAYVVIFGHWAFW